MDSDYAMNLDDCRSISGGRVFVNGELISFCSATQKFVMLSMTEAEIAAGMMAVQDLLHMYCLLESLKLKIELPMVIGMNNSGAVNIDNSWSVGFRIYQVDVLNYILHKLKDQGTVGY